MKNIKIKLLAFALFLLCAAGGFFYWLKQPYTFPAQREIATQFMHYVQAGDYDKAYDMTFKNMYTGQTLEEFKEQSLRQIGRGEYQFRYIFEKQSNGNRLRRLLNGRDVEVHQVSVDFIGTPIRLVGVRLRQDTHGQWKVYYFASHAG